MAGIVAAAAAFRFANLPARGAGTPTRARRCWPFEPRSPRDASRLSVLSRRWVISTTAPCTTTFSCR